MEIRLKNVRLRYATLAVAERVRGVSDSDPRFSATFLLPPMHPQLADVNALIKQAALELWGPQHEAILKEAKAKGKVCLADGDSKATKEGFAGNFALSASAYEDAQPALYYSDGRTRIDQKDVKRVLFWGCYVNAILAFKAWNHATGKGVKAALIGVQHLRDADRMGSGRVMAPGEFDDVSAAEDNDVSSLVG